MTNRQIEFLVKARDAYQILADATNEYIDSLTPPEVKEKEDKPATAVLELTFTMLKFEPQQGSKLGNFEVAYKKANLEDKWSQAFNILRINNSTIKDRHDGDNYQYSYWLYGEDRIYRQKLKPKTSS
jgi:hypothetical protein